MVGLRVVGSWFVRGRGWFVRGWGWFVRGRVVGCRRGAIGTPVSGGEGAGGGEGQDSDGALQNQT